MIGFNTFISKNNPQQKGVGPIPQQRGTQQRGTYTQQKWYTQQKRYPNCRTKGYPYTQTKRVPSTIYKHFRYMVSASVVALKNKKRIKKIFKRKKNKYINVR